MEDRKDQDKITEFNAVAVHPNSGFSVKGILLKTLEEAEAIEDVVVLKLYKDKAGASSSWSDQSINSLVFLRSVFELEVTEALFQAREPA